MKRVLIVDDNEENLYYLSTLLSSHGCSVETARNGQEALDIARRAPPTMVIADLLMPVMDGYTLLRSWKADPALRAAPFIVYTATYTDSEDEQLALQLGADAFILKPSEPDQLLARLDAVGASRATSPMLPQLSPQATEMVLEQYSAALIRKLEQRSLQLEEANRALKADIGARQAAERAARDSEASFRLLADAMPQLVWMADAAGQNTYVNQQWQIYTGLSAAESAGGGFTKAIHPEDQARATQVWAEAQARAETFSVELRMVRADGARRWWLLRGVPVKNDRGGIIKWFGTCTDIDELKEAGDRLRRTEDQLRQSQKMEAVGRLAGGIAHDFNNLLSVILGYTTLVLDELAPGAPFRDEIEEVRRAGERATELTRQLLAFSRQQMLQPKVLDLGVVVAGLEKMLRRLLGEDIELLLVPAAGPAKVHADPSQIEQILMNLAVNARDAMPRGGSLTLRVETVEAADVDADAAAHLDLSVGPYVRLQVTDTGIGIDPALRDKIFEPFFTTKEKGKGTGLGLSTVFGIVKQSRGHISVTSTVGAGTTFRVYLPSTQRAADGPALVDESNVQLRGTETILLVEDDEQVRGTNREILRRSGYNVLTAQNGGEAFLVSEKFSSPIHLLLTDVVMPRMSGRELADRLTLMRPGLKVLYVSGYAENAIVHHGVIDERIAFLQKPIMPDALLRKVRSVLSSS
jgi:two-component system cell cycle sensor histidine kinase/response regulator CckA